jgi:hypothetical protein
MTRRRALFTPTGLSALTQRDGLRYTCGFRMKYALAIIQVAFGFGLFLAAIAPAYPHGGGLDTYGCHHNRKAGGDHCHRGSLAGQSFSSKDEMLKRLNAEKAAPQSESKTKGK